LDFHQMTLESDEKQRGMNPEASIEDDDEGLPEDRED